MEMEQSEKQESSLRMKKGVTFKNFHEWTEK